MSCVTRITPPRGARVAIAELFHLCYDLARRLSLAEQATRLIRPGKLELQKLVTADADLLRYLGEVAFWDHEPCEKREERADEEAAKKKAEVEKKRAEEETTKKKAAEKVAATKRAEEEATKKKADDEAAAK